MARGARLAACAVAALLALGSCGGDDETPPGLYSEPCDDTTTCAPGLTCLIGICTQNCSNMNECRANLGSSSSVCVGGVCQEPCTPTQFNPCMNGLRCRQSSFGSTCLP